MPELRYCFSYFKDSEEMKSTTLDVKLKETERELKQHEKEIADQMEVKQNYFNFLPTYVIFIQLVIRD